MSRYIDADLLLEKLKLTPRYFNVKFDIENAPTAEVKPIVYGEWLIYKAYQGGIKEEWFKCSKCGWENALLIPRNFCPNCGATMKQKRERVE